MFDQTENTPNPNSLKFLPGRSVSNNGSFEVTKKEDTNNELLKNILSINGITGIFLGNVSVDVPLSDTYFVVAHFHMVMGIAPLMVIMGAIYHWFPLVAG